MSALTVRIYPYYGRVRALAIYDGEDCHSEGDTVGDALIELGYFIRSKNRPKHNDNETLMRLVLEGQTDEVRNCREHKSDSNRRNSLSKNSNK